VKNHKNGLKVLVYSFADEPVRGKMSVWALEHGVYQFTMGTDSDRDGKMDRIEQNAEMELAKAHKIDVTLASRAVTVIELEQLRELDDVSLRADLAITDRETRIEGGKLSGTIHNIGSTYAHNVAVAVLDASGRTISQQDIGNLPAPVDLVPKRLDFTLNLPEAPEENWRLVADPDNQIPEIYEGNNEVELDHIKLSGATGK
jgi:hypothetical protein